MSVIMFIFGYDLFINKSDIVVNIIFSKLQITILFYIMN